MSIKFYDTSSLLLKSHDLFDNDEKFVISSITLQELESIKNAFNKDPDVKYAARQLINELESHYGFYDIVIYKEDFNKYIKNYIINNDTKILACCCDYQKNHPKKQISFITNDLCLKHIAHIILGPKVESVKDDSDSYAGYKEVYMTDDEMTNFYQNFNRNLYNLQINEYLIIYNEDHEIADTLCWTGENYRQLTFGNFDSEYFGKIKPLKNDIYQSLVADSFLNNKITLVKGPAGSGKTFLSMAFLLHQLSKNKIDKIIVFCNTVATKNSAKLGYYPGTKDEKLLASQIGNLLSSKMGGRIIVEQMIREEKLILLPMSDIRGYDTSGMRAGVYISEAQNLDIELMKLALQRIGNDSICIIDGDCKTQVDDIAFAGSKNGMRRVSKVFRGHDVYGEINLKNIHRSKIAEIAEFM